jgi:signal transduction histidine kinase
MCDSCSAVSAQRQSEHGLRNLPDAALALAWAGFGLWNAAASSPVTAAVVGIVILTSVGVGLFRRAPAAALVLVWVAGAVQALSFSDVLGAQAGVLVVAYGTARYGSRLTVWLGGLSVPVGAALSEYYVFSHSTVLPSAIDVATPLFRHTGVGVVSAFLLGSAGLGIPWTLGLLVRFNARYRQSAVDGARAQALASEAEMKERLRSEQVQLARNVHDLVGHSLAVIIAQADAAQIGAGEQDSPVRVALENIAAVARRSLGEVRQVLQDTHERSSSTSTDLVNRCRAAGHDIQESTLGSPVELAPEVQITLYRVLQEMLTNAIKHGPPGRRIGLVHRWAATSYSLSVTNLARIASDQSPTTDADGMGVEGMRARLEQIDGTLVVSQPGGEDSPAFTATARIPLADCQSRP